MWKENLLLEEDLIREQLNELDMHKSMGFGRMYPKVLRDLTGITVRLLAVVLERLC